MAELSEAKIRLVRKIWQEVKKNQTVAHSDERMSESTARQYLVGFLLRRMNLVNGGIHDVRLMVLRIIETWKRV